MNLKTLGLTASFVTVGLLGISDAASAAKFNDGDAINLNIPSFQINAAGLPGFFPNLPSGEFNGGADGLADALFGTLNTTVPTQPTDVVINNTVTGTDFKPGDLGQVTVAPSINAFDNYRNTIAQIRSFDGTVFPELSEVNGGFDPVLFTPGVGPFPPNVPPNNFLLKLPAVNAANQEVFFYLTEITSFDLADSLANGFGNLTAKGWMKAVGDDADVAFYDVDYTLSIQALADNGNFTDVTPGDGVTGAVTASSTNVVIRINRQGNPVPEPSTIIGLSAVAGAGLMMKKKKLASK